MEDKHRDRNVATSLVLALKRSHSKGSGMAVISVLQPKMVCNKILIKFLLSEIWDHYLPVCVIHVS